MKKIDKDFILLKGPKGSLQIQSDDHVALRLAMLYEGKCTDLGSTKAAKKYGYTKQRFSQLFQAFSKNGSLGLQPQNPGPKKNYVRTENVINQIIRLRFLDPDASADVIAQKLRQTGTKISKRSVELTITEHGLQKKTSSSSDQKTKRKK